MICRHCKHDMGKAASDEDCPAMPKDYKARDAIEALRTMALELDQISDALEGWKADAGSLATGRRLSHEAWGLRHSADALERALEESRTGSGESL